MTLYRIVKTQMVDGDQYAMDGAMYMGRLVPVEPDYEAAAIESGLYAPGMKEFARDHAKRVVDAALGIGETP